MAVLGVGGVESHGQSFTELYPEEAALVAKWLGVKVAFPIHYRFDEGAAFVKEIRRQAPKVKPVLLKAGETYRFDKKAGERAPPGRQEMTIAKGGIPMPVIMVSDLIMEGIAVTAAFGFPLIIEGAASIMAGAIPCEVLAKAPVCGRNG